MSADHPSKPQLVLVDYKQSQPGAKRIFWMFKPREAVTGEPFNLSIAFRNNSERELSGGKCYLYVDTAEGAALDPYEIDMPAIASKVSRTVAFENLAVQELGYSAFRVSVRNPGGEEVLNDYESRRLTNASLEELYQKYAVVVALFFSTLATVLTIMNIIVSLFK